MKKLILSCVILGAAIVLVAQQRLDVKVRNYFFSGFQGNDAALDKGMKICEDALAANPKDAEAMVWHGSGLYFRAGLAFRKGDPQTGMDLWTRGNDEMDKAVTLSPESVATRIPRGAVLLSSSHYIPDQAMAREVTAKGVADFEKTYELQKSDFHKLGTHARGELMLALADGHSRLGENDKAQYWFDRIRTELKGTLYEDSANVWIKTKSLQPRQAGCLGCHTGE
jgi:hypothetical protein